jgi:TetR/AcrR family transcriptional repressor of mexJK operon
MATRSTPGSRATLVRKVEKRVAAGASISDACGAVNVSVPSYYRWRGEGRLKPAPDDSRALQMIIAAATPLFLADGFGVNIERVAQAAGVSRQSVFNHIGSKEFLFREVVSAIQLRLMDFLPNLPKTEDTREFLTAFAIAYAQAACDPEGMALHRLLIAECNQFPDLARLSRSLGLTRALPLISQFLAARMAAGTLHRSDPELTAESFLSAVIGRSRFRVLLGETLESKQRRNARLRNAVDIFVRGLSA